MSFVKVRVFREKEELGKAAASHAATAIRRAIDDRGLARIIAATGASQFDFLEALTSTPGIDWQKVELFHLDEYIGLPMNHAASFCKYLQERLIAKTGIIRHHLLNGTDEPTELIRRVEGELKAAQIDVAFVGIGENGHLAFNDPPADFETKDAYLIVNLDEACRRQQVGEGWFANLSGVPKRAISMSVRQILTAKEIIAVVPDARKAQAVRACIEGPINPMAPASILRTHPDTTIFLDGQSASLLSPTTLSALAVSG